MKNIDIKIKEFEEKCERIMKRFDEKTNRIINNIDFKKPSRIKLFLQHHLNELHLYCRLVKIGINTDKAKQISSFIYKNAKIIL